MKKIGSLVGLVLKNLLAKDVDWIPWVGKIPCKRKWQPTPIFSPGKPRGQRSLAGCSLPGCGVSGMTAHTKKRNQRSGASLAAQGWGTWAQPRPGQIPQAAERPSPEAAELSPGAATAGPRAHWSLWSARGGPARWEVQASRLESSPHWLQPEKSLPSTAKNKQINKIT